MKTKLNITGKYNQREIHVNIDTDYAISNYMYKKITSVDMAGGYSVIKDSENNVYFIDDHDPVNGVYIRKEFYY